MDEAEKLDTSIEHIEDKLERYRKLKELVRELEKDNNSDVTVINMPDSPITEVLITSYCVNNAIKKIKNLSHRSDDIVYQPEKEKYIFETKFRTDC